MLVKSPFPVPVSGFVRLRLITPPEFLFTAAADMQVAPSVGGVVTFPRAKNVPYAMTPHPLKSDRFGFRASS
ncbi:hypothetical protein GCM10023156_22630 [Novipirellula rosea]|uniref:Uncharacterized protein n=1 Tax=Novipirellula rosea TaxID=1031540 RepID=A0ABP8MP24_9BACT